MAMLLTFTTELWVPEHDASEHNLDCEKRLVFTTVVEAVNRAHAIELSIKAYEGEVGEQVTADPDRWMIGLGSIDWGYTEPDAPERA